MNKGRTSKNYRHVIFLCAGMNGTTSACKYMVKTLRKALRQKSTTLIHVCKANWPKPISYFKTKDGIDRGGARLADEIKLVCSIYKGSLETISFIGISLGGLYFRYAIGHLIENDRICGLLPKVFITIGTPHIGINSRHLSATQIWLTRSLLGITGKQILLEDDSLDEDSEKRETRNLLREMASPDSSYIKALSIFESRFAYAISKQDSGRVPFCSAAILPDWNAYISENGSMKMDQEQSTCISPHSGRNNQPEEEFVTIEKKLYPHIVDEKFITPGTPRHMSPPTSPCTSSINTMSSISSEVNTAPFGNEEMTSSEWEMINGLRSQMSWSHVIVDFPEWYGEFLNHNSMAVNAEWLNGIGKDVARHIAQKVVLSLAFFMYPMIPFRKNKEENESNFPPPIPISIETSSNMKKIKNLYPEAHFDELRINTLV